MWGESLQSNYNANFMNITLKNGSRSGMGSGSRTTNIRLGLKTGGIFYFRIEMGYGFGNLPRL